MNDEIKRSILTVLYSAWHSGLEELPDLESLCASNEWDVKQFRRTVSALEHRGMLRELGFRDELTAAGVRYAEDSGIAPSEDYEANQAVRSNLCFALKQALENQDLPDSVPYQVLARFCEIDQALALRNLELLAEVGYIAWEEVGCVVLTERGYQAIEAARLRQVLLDEFGEVAAMPPHPRGIAFQVLFAKLLEHSGWSKQDSVRLPGEEIDVVISREREHYLIECKWERDPVGAPTIREFLGKLNKRSGVNGLFVSMSGFTGPAIEEAEGGTASKLVLFFGPKDVERLFNGQRTFDDLLTKKHTALSIVRRIEFE